MNVVSDITSPTSWTEENAYVIYGDVRAYSTLAIEPGTTVKFASGGSLSTAGSGAIIAYEYVGGTPWSYAVWPNIRYDAH